jgi:hypothetical protein
MAQTVIAIHRPTLYFLAAARRLNLWIDGVRAGKVWPGTMAEFAVEPGEHTVSVSTSLAYSRPLRIVAKSESRSDITVGIRWMDTRCRCAPVAAPATVERTATTCN